MSLRKSPSVTPDLAAANRGNAQNSTGPRTPAGKDHSRLNALKHGLYTAAQNEPVVMLALGEDPAEFEAERQALLESYGPGDELWYHQIDDLAKLYWRRSRLERAQGALVRRSPLRTPGGPRRTSGQGRNRTRPKPQEKKWQTQKPTERSRNVYENKRTPPRHQDTKAKPPWTTQPSPLGRGWTGAALLPAAPGRVRGLFLSLAQPPGRGLASFGRGPTPPRMGVKVGVPARSRARVAGVVI